MYAIHYNIKEDSILRDFITILKINIENIFAKGILILIEPKNSDFKNVVRISHSFFKEKSLDIDDFIYIYNFVGYDENDWYCDILKKAGRKTMNMNYRDS